MSNWLKTLLILVFLAFMLALAYRQTMAPAERPDSGLDFAALEGHVAVIAARPHPMGSAANREVRDYITGYFESLGLATEVQKTTVVYRHPFRSSDRTTIANVENIIARLPGRNSETAGGKNDLVLMSHYDSRPLTFGAADAASGTASLMEVARIMTSGPVPAHDVVFLVTDGEEMGLLGAQGFFRQHPAAARVGLVLNFEARGSYGASSMFETSEQNGWLIENLIESAPGLVASSLGYEIYRRMPNDTDMSISKGEGIPGLNFAFVSGLADYHAATDTAENLDKNTLAQQADYALATARHFAMLDEWRTADANVTYFNLWQGRVASYSQPVAVGIGVLVLALGLWLFARALRGGALKPASLGSGLLGLAVLILMVSSLFESMIDYAAAADAGIERLLSLGEWPLLAYFVTTLGLCAWFAAAIRRGFRPAEIWVATLGLAAVSLLAARPWLAALALVVILAPGMLLLRSRKNAPDLWGAALLLWWLLTAAVLYIAPNGSYLLVWPLASALAGFALVRQRAPAKADGNFLPALASSLVPFLLLPPLVIMAYLALGSSLPQMIMIIVVLGLLLIWPLVQNLDVSNSGNPGLVLLAAGLAITTAAVFMRDFDTRHPRGEALFYACDVDRQEGFWLSPDARPGSWINGFMGEDAEPYNMGQILPGYDETVLKRSPEALGGVGAASLEITGDRLVDGRRELSLHLQSPAGAEYINLLFSVDAGITSAAVNGFEVEVPQSAAAGEAGGGRPDADKNRDKGGDADWWRWRWYGLPAAGADIVLRLQPDRGLTVKIVEVDYGMPDGAPQRPAGSMPRPYTWSDSRVIFQTRELGGL